MLEGSVPPFRKHPWLWIFVLGGMFNFIVFVAVAVYLGGDALNGKAVDGHYYLASHGSFTEVGENVFTYSKWHALSVFITHPLAMLSGWLMTRQNRS